MSVPLLGSATRTITPDLKKGNSVKTASPKELISALKRPSLGGNDWLCVGLPIKCKVGGAAAASHINELSPRVLKRALSFHRKNLPV